MACIRKRRGKWVADWRDGGGVRHWMTFDHDTMRVAAAWSGTTFIDWQGIHFDGRHNAHPHVVGLVTVNNPSGPGWADPATGSFDDNQRVVGRDGRRYGPLPSAWAKYRGLYHHGDRAIASYTVGATSILESAGLVLPAAGPAGVPERRAKPLGRGPAPPTTRDRPRWRAVRRGIASCSGSAIAGSPSASGRPRWSTR